MAGERPFMAKSWGGGKGCYDVKTMIINHLLELVKMRVFKEEIGVDGK